jgi:glycosyltransferase involved in cell wall biosynthesis
MNLAEISVVVTTYNEESNIGRCLEPLQGFGEIVVVDSHSTDRTLEIARRHPVRIHARDYESAAKQKNWALGVVRHDWVLVLDADEELTPELRREIAALHPELPGYWIRRDSEYLGRRIHFCGWQQDKVLRLFRRDRGRYVETEVHEEVSLDGRAGLLRGRLRHYPYRSLEQHLQKINAYTTRGAKDFVRGGGRLPFLRLLLNPPLRFLRMYILQLGFLDGAQGLVLCLVSAYGVMLKYAKARELARNARREGAA